MKILYIQQHFATNRGEAGVRGYNLVKMFADRGHEVTVICGRNWRDRTLEVTPAPGKSVAETDQDGYHLVQIHVYYSNLQSFAKRIGSFLSFAFRACREAAKRPADLVFVSSTPLTVTIPAIFVRVFQRKPYVLEIRDLWPELPAAMGIIKNPIALRALEFWEALSYRKAWRLVGLAPGIRDGILTRGKRKPEHVLMVPNGADTDGLQPRPGRPRKHLPIPDDRLVFGYTGTHGPANGLDAVLDAADVLKKRGVTDIVFALIGDGKEKPRLEARAKALGLDNVVFTGLYDKSLYNDVLAEIDVGMQILKNIPAFYTGTSPNKFFDYLAVGRPVLVNYPGWMSDLVAADQCGVSVPPDDPTAFADAVQALAARRELFPAMGLRSRSLAEREFRQQTILRDLVAYLETEAVAAGIGTTKTIS